MNTSRDIEKLFDHFGGNASDYQEIGRENEAKSARTRWPLLATLDFAQPTIPEIAPRRAVPPNALRATASKSAAASPASPASSVSADRPTPIHRGRPQLFTRPHRRTIPPVDAPAAETLSALRFSALGEPAPNESSTIPVASSVPPVVAQTAAGRASTGDHAQHEPVHPPVTFGSNFLASRSAAADAPARSPRHQQAPEPAPQTILGQLFKPQTPPAPAAPANALQSMFDRLRHADEPANIQASADRASRLSRL
jgi:hypothetical protein